MSASGHSAACKCRECEQRTMSHRVFCTCAECTGRNWRMQQSQQQQASPVPYPPPNPWVDSAPHEAPSPHTSSSSDWQSSCWGSPSPRASPQQGPATPAWPSPRGSMPPPPPAKKVRSYDMDDEEEDPHKAFFGDWNPQQADAQHFAVEQRLRVYLALDEYEKQRNFNPAEEARRLMTKAKALKAASRFEGPAFEEKERRRTQALDHIQNAMEQLQRSGSLNETPDELMGMEASLAQALRDHLLSDPTQVKCAKSILGWIRTQNLPRH